MLQNIWSLTEQDDFHAHHGVYVLNSYLQEPDEVGEDEEHGGLVDPLQHAEEDEGPAIYDEASRKYCFHPPY